MGGDGEERRGEHGQGDVPVPGLVFADLVVVQAGLVFGEREGFLHAPAGSGDADQFDQGDWGEAVADVVGQFGRFADGAADQQCVDIVAGIDQQPVIQAMTFAALAG